jgi:hypothetical protein
VRCYLDNDALHKLAALGLVDEALAAIGADELRVLATARFRFMVAKNPDKGRAKFGDVVWERLRAVLEVTGGVGPTDAKDLDVLTDVLDIDEGEAVLFSAAARLPESVLVTGDKRSLQALAGASSCEEIIHLRPPQEDGAAAAVSAWRVIGHEVYDRPCPITTR